MKNKHLPHATGLLLLLIAGICISGCVTVQNPEIQIKKISITDISLKQMIFTADIEAYNPNSMELELSNLDITISYKEGNTIEKIGTGSFERIKIPAKGREHITIPIIVKNFDIIKTVVSFLKTGEMRIMTTGSGQYDIMFMHNTVAFTHEMDLSIDNVEGAVKDTMQELISTVQGTKTTVDRVKNLVTPVKEGVEVMINLIQNNSTPLPV
jgi:LEA14-like dessication related protein